MSSIPCGRGGRGPHFSALDSLEYTNSCLSDSGIMLHNFVASLSAPLIKHSDDRVGILKFGTLSNDDGNGNEKVKNVTGLLSKTSSLHVHHAFLFISLPSLHDLRRENA